MADEATETIDAPQTGTDTGVAATATPASTSPSRGTVGRNKADDYNFDDLDDGFSDVEADHVSARQTGTKPPTDADEDDDSGVDTETPASDGEDDSKKGTDAAPAGTGIDAALLSRAHKLGMSAEKAREFESPAALKRALDWAESRTQQGSDTGLSREREEKPADQQQGKKPRINLEAFELDERFDPALHAMAKNLKGMAEQINSAFDELEQRTELTNSQAGKLTEWVQQREQEAFYDRFDSWVNSLGADWEPVFGKGGRKDVASNQAAVEARGQVLNEMLIYAAGYRQANPTGQIPDERELFQRAVRALHGDKTEKMAAQKVTQQLRDRRSGQFTTRPTQRQSKGDHGTSDERAQRFVNKFFSERGVDEVEGDGI